MTFSHGEGVYLYRYRWPTLPGCSIAGIAVNGLGHAHPAVTKAIRDQADKLVHTSNLYRIEVQEQLAETLCAGRRHGQLLFRQFRRRG